MYIHIIHACITLVTVIMYIKHFLYIYNLSNHLIIFLMQFQCSICLEPFDLKDKIPMVLPCGHTYCLNCIYGFNGAICPHDRIPFEVYSRNFTLITILENKEEIISKIKSEGTISKLKSEVKQEKLANDIILSVFEPSERATLKETSLKIIMIGSDCVGKTSMIFRFTRNEFMNQRVTIGLDVKNLIEEHNGENFKFRFWDSVGQEKYKSLSKISYQNTDLAIFVFSLDNTDSLQDIRSYWLEETKSGCPGALFCLIGNKSDLKQNNINNKAINQSLIKQIKKHCFLYRQISCKTGQGISQTWSQLSKSLISRHSNNKKFNKNSVHLHSFSEEAVRQLHHNQQANNHKAQNQSNGSRRMNNECC